MKKNLKAKSKFYPKVKKILFKPHKIKMSSLLYSTIHESFDDEMKIVEPNRDQNMNKKNKKSFSIVI